MTYLLPQWGMPTDWMMKITTWQKNTKKKKKKLKELSVLNKEKETHHSSFSLRRHIYLRGKGGVYTHMNLTDMSKDYY